jgi:hypothetical protein
MINERLINDGACIASGCQGDLSCLTSKWLLSKPLILDQRFVVFHSFIEAAELAEGMLIKQQEDKDVPASVFRIRNLGHGTGIRLYVWRGSKCRRRHHHNRQLVRR